jgi:hypothetical protein
MHNIVHLSARVSTLFWMLEGVLGFAFLFIATRKKLLGMFWLRAYLWLKVASFVTLFPLVVFHLFSADLRYSIFFFAYWSFYAVEAVLSFCVIRELFLIALEPLEGLQRLGLMVFRWVVTIAALVAIAVSFGPHTSMKLYISNVVGELQRCQSILQLCLMLFLYTVARPLGITGRSKVFGVSVGFSVLALADLLYSGWFSRIALDSSINMFHAAALTMAIAVWITYCYIPEPKRLQVTLPMTSALLRWNEVAMNLGKTGGRVMVVGNHEAITQDLEAYSRAVAIVRAKHQQAS